MLVGVNDVCTYTSIFVRTILGIDRRSEDIMMDKVTHYANEINMYVCVSVCIPGARKRLLTG